MENSIEEDIKKLRESIIKEKYHIYNKDLKIILEHILSDYKRVLKINEVLLKENEELKIKNNAIKRESEAYAEYMIRLDNELNLEKEKSKYEWIRQNCLSQELVNKLYIPIQKVKDKIKEEKMPLTIVGGIRNKKILEYGISLGRMQVLQELIEEREEKE